MNQGNKELKIEAWKIAIPAILESLFTTFSSIIDTKMVSSMGTKAISAVSVTYQPRIFILSVFFAINTSVSAIVAQNVGRKDQKKSNETFITAFSICLILTVIVSAVTIIFSKQIMMICSGQEDTMDLSIIYFKIIMAGFIFQTSYMLINAALRGFGSTNLTFITNVISSLVNIFFNYCLIYGNFGFPRLQIAGAAIATVIGNIVAFIICIITLANKNLWVNLWYCIKNKILATIDTVKNIYDMWVNLCGERISTRLGFLIISAITARIGSSEMALYSIGLTLMNINFAFGDGLQAAAIALVGRSYGEKDNEKVKKYSHVIQEMGIKCSLVIAIIYVIFRKQCIAFYISEANLISIGAMSCLIIALIVPIQIAQLIYDGVLKAIGKTKEILYTSLISTIGLNVVLLFVLVIIFNGGIISVWIAGFVSQLLKLILLYIFYRKSIYNKNLV